MATAPVTQARVCESTLVSPCPCTPAQAHGHPRLLAGGNPALHTLSAPRLLLARPGDICWNHQAVTTLHIIYIVAELCRWLHWKRPLRSPSLGMNPAMPRPSLHHVPKCHNVTAFKYPRGGDCTLPWADVPGLSVKKCFLLSNLNLLWCSLKPFLPISPLATWEKRPTPPG